MTVVNPAAGWPDIDVIDPFERLLGGPNGPMNRSTVSLTSRTRWLRDYVDSLSGPTGSAGLGFRGAAGTAVTRSVQDKLRDAVSVKDFGAVGDGAANDTAAVQAGIDYVAARGGVLYFPAGDYRLTAQVGINTMTAAAFTLRGAGWSATRLIRGSDYGSVVSFGNVSNFAIEDLSVVCNYATFSANANHGIVWFNGSNNRISRVKVIDWKNSAIIGYSATGGDLSYGNNLVEYVQALGTGNQNNGILYADQVNSGFVNCLVLDVGKTGSPCYGIQFKENSQNCYVIGGYTRNCSIGIACGNTLGFGDAHVNGRIIGTHVYNCDTGIAFGNSRGYVTDSCIIDMNSAGNGALDFQGGSLRHQVQNLSVKNLAANKSAVVFRTGDTDNVVDIGVIENASNIAELAVTFGAGALRNFVSVGRYARPTITATTNLVGNSSDSTNVFEYRSAPTVQAATIAGDAITLRHGKIALVQVDTEASAPTDLLATINGAIDRQVITVNQAANARDVTIKHGTGNIRLNGAVDFAFTTVQQNVTLMYLAAVSQWVEVSRGTAT